ncbi:aminoacyl-tRNA hydrolase [Candidatus Aerophobetes bacterium Ae_b3a]|nr:MAG: aminoacyl-tRNA hydrolase [Candidatus Aerophobetes bacterium Ae_b3a]
MRVIFGLGNPGKAYEQSRHNIGFRVIDKLSQEHRIELNKHSCQAWIGEGEVGREEVFLVKPLTLVNAAGVSLLQLKQKHEVSLEDIMVISDDVNLELGKLRLARRGGDGGHKGLRSIIEFLGTEEFPRLRLGIDRPEEKVELKEYVLGEFTFREKKVIEETISRASQAVEMVIRQGIDETMKHYN